MGWNENSATTGYATTHRRYNVVVGGENPRYALESQQQKEDLLNTTLTAKNCEGITKEEKLGHGAVENATYRPQGRIKLCQGGDTNNRILRWGSDTLEQKRKEGGEKGAATLGFLGWGKNRGGGLLNDFRAIRRRSIMERW